MKRTITSALPFLLVLTSLFSISNPNPALAVEITQLEKTFTRGTGAPATESISFDMPVAMEATLRIINGGGWYSYGHG